MSSMSGLPVCLMVFKPSSLRRRQFDWICLNSGEIKVGGEKEGLHLDYLPFHSPQLSRFGLMTDNLCMRFMCRQNNAGILFEDQLWQREVQPQICCYSLQTNSDHNLGSMCACVCMFLRVWPRTFSGNMFVFFLS